MAHSLTKAGRYEIVSELGRGSMGVVYKGFDPVIGRSVAIKTMLIEGLTSTEFQEYKARFQREAQAAGILAHPNIVTVYDFGEDSGVLFLAMEFLDGKSLQDLVEKQTILPVETIIPMFEQVCSALDHAHSHNIVHRDIKPANIMILNSGLVKVTDFGIAKIMSMGMTQAGQILGTPNYMSPEQVKGRKVDGRADIFALGVILYELVTGEKPFGGQNITTVIYKIINENPIPPRELDSTIHPGLSFVISKALAKTPEDRFQTCRELAEALKNYRTMGGTPVPNATVVIKGPPLQPQPPEPARTATRAAAPEVQSLAVDLGRQRPPASQSRIDQQPLRQAPPPSFTTAQPEAKGTPPIVWTLLLILLFCTVGGAGYYFLFMNRGAGPTQVETPPPQTNVAPPAQAPVETATPATQEPATPAPEGSETAAPPEQTPSEPEPQKPEAPPPAKPAAPVVAKKPEPKKTEPPSKKVVAAPSPGLKYGTLFVTSAPQGAQITIDGRSDPDWVTPRTIDGLSAGTHVMILSKEGFSSARRSVSVRAGRTQPVNVQLASFNGPATPGRTTTRQPTENTPQATATSNGIIVIQTVPPGIDITIDGAAAGKSPVRQVVSPGSHTVKLLQSGTEIYSGTIEVKPGQVAMRKYNLGQ